MVGLNGNAFGRTRDLCGSSRDRGAVPRRERRNQIGSRHAIISSWFPEKIFASLFFDQAELFELEVGALDLAFIDGEFLCERGGRRKRLTWSHRLVADVSLNLLAHLQVDGIVRHVLQFNVHSFKVCASLLKAIAAHPDRVLLLPPAAPQKVVRELCKEWAREIHRSRETSRWTAYTCRRHRCHS